MEKMEKYIELQTLFKELYLKGLVGVSDSYIQVTPEQFKEFCPEKTMPNIEKYGKSIQLQFKTADGTVFLTVI